MLWASSHAFAFLMVSHWLIPYMVNKTGLLIYFWIALNITPLSLWAAAQGEGPGERLNFSGPSETPSCQGACALSVLYLSLIKLRIRSAASMHSSRGATRATRQCPLPGCGPFTSRDRNLPGSTVTFCVANS